MPCGRVSRASVRVNVSGLLCGRDYAEQLRGLAPDCFILPRPSLDYFGKQFLDSMTVEQLEASLSAPVAFASQSIRLNRGSGSEMAVFTRSSITTGHTAVNRIGDCARNHASGDGMCNGRIHAMNDTSQAPIDQAGRVVIPKAIRERAGVYGGMVFDIVVRDDAVIELHPAPRAVRIAHEDGLPVAVPVEPADPLSQDVVRETIRRLREARAE